MTVLSVMPGQTPERMVLEETLEAMQTFVSGTIQAIYPFDDTVAIICNDNAKLLGLPYNRVLRDEEGNIHDILCGPFFVCGLGEEDFSSLTETQLETYGRLFAHPELFMAVGGQLVVVQI